ncbi:MAG: hypothetical protein ACE5PO_02450, partial [Candidatus Bathyarchaeia archaeon]
KDIARVTLHIDNTPIGGKKPVPGCSSDLFQLSRYLKKDGTYWYEADYREVSKAQVSRILQALGINPDNMLSIMHQNMIEELTVLPPQQKLRLVEEAVGFHTYREQILEAEDRLKKLLSEEESINTLLSSAEQTLAHWRMEYEKLKRKQQLLKRRKDLECELTWTHVHRAENSLKGLLADRDRKTRVLQGLTERMEKTRSQTKQQRQNINNLRIDHRKLFYAVMADEKELSAGEAYVTLSGDIVSRLRSQSDQLEAALNGIPSEEASGRHILAKRVKTLAVDLAEYADQLQKSTRKYTARGAELRGKIKQMQTELADVEESLARLEDKYVDGKVHEATLAVRAELVQDQLDRILNQITQNEHDIKELTEAAEKIGPRIKTARLINDVEDELRLTAATLASLGEVSDDAEKMYNNYQTLFNELKEKAQVVSETRKQALTDIDMRKTVWRRVWEEFMEEVGKRYQTILQSIDGEGSVRLTEPSDVATSGLELLVGFKGAKPTVLNAYTQSGGERTTAVMCFLLALQQNLKSPVRAVDEFDIHMDPRNRELVSELIVSIAKQQRGVQYLVITPGHLPVLDETVNVITVQNIGGRSTVRSLK